MSPLDPIRPDPEPPIDVEGLTKLGVVLTAAVGVPAVVFMFVKAGLLGGLVVAIGLVALWIKLNQALAVTAEEQQSGRRRTLLETLFVIGITIALLGTGIGMMASR